MTRCRTCGRPIVPSSRGWIHKSTKPKHNQHMPVPAPNQPTATEAAQEAHG